MNALRLGLCAGALALCVSGCSLPAAWVAGITVGAAVATVGGESLTAVHRVEQIETDAKRLEAIPGTIEHKVASDVAKVKERVQAKRARFLAHIRSGNVGKFLYDTGHPVALPAPNSQPKDVPAQPPKWRIDSRLGGALGALGITGAIVALVWLLTRKPKPPQSKRKRNRRIAALAFGLFLTATPAKADDLEDAWYACWSRNLDHNSAAHWDGDCKVINGALAARRDRQASDIQRAADNLIHKEAQQIRKGTR